jgi:hypothetical protein
MKIMRRFIRWIRGGVPPLDLDPISNYGQVHYVIALRAAGQIGDDQWSNIFLPAIEGFLRDNLFPRVYGNLEEMEKFGKAVKAGR